MTDDRYAPILVAWPAASSDLTLARCLACGAEENLDPADGDPSDLCLSCAACGGSLAWKYEPVDPCPNCGKLAYDAVAVDGACSRACALQVAYARTLEAAA
jgi:hypothetical protein